MNFIICIYSYVTITCHCIGPLTNTYCVVIADNGNYEIHSITLLIKSKYFCYTSLPSIKNEFKCTSCHVNNKEFIKYRVII